MIYETIIYITIILMTVAIIAFIESRDIYSQIFAINIISSKICLIMMVLGIGFKLYYFIDIAYIYTLSGFVVTMLIKKYKEV